MSNGQPATQYWQPMHFVWSKFTMPFVYWTMAPGAGQAARQPGSSQWRQLSLRMSQARSPPSSSISLNRMRSHVAAVRSGWLW